MNQSYAAPQTTGGFERQPLGLPKGTIRGIIAGSIVGLFCLLLWLPAHMPAQVPLFLYGLMGVVMVFFVLQPAPLAGVEAGGSFGRWLGGVLYRAVLIGALVATFVFQYLNQPDLLRARLTPSPGQMQHWPEMLVCVGGGFLLGYLLSLTPLRKAPLFQDIVAWISNLAILGLIACVLIYGVIKPTLTQDWDTVGWEFGMAAVLSFYFGARSGA